MKKGIKTAYQQGTKLRIAAPEYRNWLKRCILEELKSDLGHKGDITSNSLIGNEKAAADIISKEKGILAGAEELIFLASMFGIKIKMHKKDGMPIKDGSRIATLIGKAKTILRLERLMLNMLQRMSGIATATWNIIKKTKNKAAIAPTRKTLLRYLDKKAVYVAGGVTHRFGLFDAILIKDNHLNILKRKHKNYVEKAIEKACKSRKQARFIGIEVKNTKEALEAARIGAKVRRIPFILLLDNISAGEIRNIVNTLKEEMLRNNVLLEASGGITEKNAVAYAKAGVDVISIGSLTHSVKALDMGMEMR